jgi:hypothetical protein
MWREGEVERWGRRQIWRKTSEGGDNGVREAAAAVEEGGEEGLGFWVGGWGAWGARVYIGRGTPGSPSTRLTAVPDKWVRPTRRPADLSVGPTDLVGGPHDLLKTFQKIPQTT